MRNKLIKKKTKICIVSGSRADYGILKNLIKSLKSKKELITKFVVTGQHLSPEYGLTYKQIKKDGIIIDSKIECLVSSDTSVGISTSTALSLMRFASFFNSEKPDVIILLGDRYEIFAVSVAALIANIPIAHIHGGELTEGAIDEAFRHSITKMSNIHFVAALDYKKRVLQLGEDPKNVHLVGSLSIDFLNKMKFIKKNDLIKMLNIRLSAKNLLVTFHPVTLEKMTSETQIDELIKSLSKLEETTIVFTLPNSDSDSRIMIKKIQTFKKNNPNVYLFNSLGQLYYFSLINIFDGVIGNSSSGLIEVPSLKKGTINIGDRQKGRLSATSVINCHVNSKSISKAIKKLYSDTFQQTLPKTINPYKSYNPIDKIISVIKRTDLKNLTKKKFIDIKF